MSKPSTHSVVVVNKTFKTPTVKSLGTDYIVLISVLCPDGSIYIYIYIYIYSWSGAAIVTADKNCCLETKLKL
jgi:hypothetical protein